MTDFNFSPRIMLNKVFVMNLEKRIKYGLHAPIFGGEGDTWPTIGLKLTESLWEVQGKYNSN